MTTTDTHLRIAELQDKICTKLGIESKNLLFDFHEFADYVDLDLITVNPKHKQSFLFHSTEGRDRIEALEQMFNYVSRNIAVEDSFTIQWSLKGDHELHTSYFRAKSIMDALDKFYFGRSVNSVVVYSVILNPVS